MRRSRGLQRRSRGLRLLPDPAHAAASPTPEPWTRSPSARVASRCSPPAQRPVLPDLLRDAERARDCRPVLEGCAPSPATGGSPSGSRGNPQAQHSHARADAPDRFATTRRPLGSRARRCPPCWTGSDQFGAAPAVPAHDDAAEPRRNAVRPGRRCPGGGRSHDAGRSSVEDRREHHERADIERAARIASACALPVGKARPMIRIGDQRQSLPKSSSTFRRSPQFPPFPRTVPSRLLLCAPGSRRQPPGDVLRRVRRADLSDVQREMAGDDLASATQHRDVARAGFHSPPAAAVRATRVRGGTRPDTSEARPTARDLAPKR